MLYKTNSSLAYTQSDMAISIHFQGTPVPCARLAMALWGTCKCVGGLWSIIINVQFESSRRFKGFKIGDARRGGMCINKVIIPPLEGAGHPQDKPPPTTAFIL